ncbi:hypothetical protein BH23PLA1_BH23PLA1_12740 [soil metagenome]
MDRREEEPPPRSERWGALPGLFYGAVLLAFLLWWLMGLSLFIWHKVLIFDELAYDGAFQLLNPLRRIAAGQIGGVDFQVFHGIGVPYLHYPFYRLAGGTLQASELTRYVLTPALFLASTVAVGASATRRFGGTLALLVAAIILVDAFDLNELYIPGIALRGVRSTMPVLAFAILLGLRAGPRRDILLGACLAFGFLLGTEQGVALWLGFTFAPVFDLALKGPRRPKLSSLARVQIVGLTLLAASLLGIGGPSGAVGALRFALIEQPADQFWFFGATPQNFVASGWQLLQDQVFLPPVLLGTLLHISSLALLVRGRDPEDSRFALAATAFLTYGLITCLAYFGFSSILYMTPLKRVILLVLLAGLGQFGLRIARESDSARRVSKAIRPGLALGLIALMVWGHPGALYAKQGLLDAPRLARDAKGLADAMRNYGTRHYEASWGEYLQGSTLAIEADRTANSGPFVLWSSFASLLEEHYGLFQPDTDYLFHALGPERRAGYVESFRTVRPDYAQTLRRAYLPTPDTTFRQIEEHLQVTYWGFYEDLLINYEILHLTDRSILWKRKPAPWQAAPEGFEGTIHPVRGQGLAFGSHRGEIELPVPADLPDGTILVLRVTYRIHNPRAWVPFLGRLPRYLLHPIGSWSSVSITLPPYAREATFPIVLRAGEVPRLSPEVAAGNAGLRLEQIEWRTIPPSEASRLLLLDLGTNEVSPKTPNVNEVAGTVGDGQAMYLAGRDE